MTNQPEILFDLRLRISAADASELREIEAVEICHIIGISDTERASLFEAVNRRYGTLNAQAVGQPKSRW